jgi:hypothetical protein
MDSYFIIIPLGRKNVKCREGFRDRKVVVCQMFKFGFIGELGFLFRRGKGGEAPFTPTKEETQLTDKPKFERIPL